MAGASPRPSHGGRQVTKRFENYELTITEREDEDIIVMEQDGKPIEIPIEQLGIVINHLDEIYKAHHEEKES